MRNSLTALARTAFFVAACLSWIEAHAQLRPEITRCNELKDDAALAQLGSCSLHRGCNIVLTWQKDCTKAIGFLNSLKATLAGRRAISNNDVFEAQSPVLTADENLKKHVAAVQRVIRDAPHDPSRGPLELKGKDGSRVFYEGGIDKNGNMHGVGILINESGFMMRGQWNAGRPGGLAQSVNDDGAMFVGIFNSGAKLQGNGAHQARNGVVFAGAWSDGKPIGRIESTHRDGVTRKIVYDGQGNQLSESPYAPPGQISYWPGEGPPAAVAPAPPSPPDTSTPGSPDFQPRR